MKTPLSPYEKMRKKAAEGMTDAFLKSEIAAGFDREALIHGCEQFIDYLSQITWRQDPIDFVILKAVAVKAVTSKGEPAPSSAVGCWVLMPPSPSLPSFESRPQYDHNPDQS